METLTMRNVMHCEVCQDSGFEVVMEDGRPVAKYCACLPRRRTLYYLKKSGLEGVLERCRFDNFQTGEEFQRRMLELCRGFVEQDERRMLYLSGCTGAGKTHLGFAVCGHFLSRGRGVIYRSYQQLMNEMKSALNSDAYEELLRDYGRADVLYIDDFMKYPPSAADIRHSFELINRRVMTQGVTVITSEQPLDAVIGYDEALGGRIRQQCGEFALYVAPGPGRNWRLK
ncbi:MAG: ATP-binding protein [Christensenellaceae bacterium]|nr:ATP-binding protein [Christensenellaceae bacterium]